MSFKPFKNIQIMSQFELNVRPFLNYLFELDTDPVRLRK